MLVIPAATTAKAPAVTPEATSPKVAALKSKNEVGIWVDIWIFSEILFIVSSNFEASSSRIPLYLSASKLEILFANIFLSSLLFL